MHTASTRAKLQCNRFYKDNPYLALTGELWDVFREFLLRRVSARYRECTVHSRYLALTLLTSNCYALMNSTPSWHNVISTLSISFRCYVTSLHNHDIVNFRISWETFPNPLKAICFSLSTFFRKSKFKFSFEFRLYYHDGWLLRNDFNSYQPALLWTNTTGTFYIS